jgi:hypothetical protein
MSAIRGIHASAIWTKGPDKYLLFWGYRLFTYYTIFERGRDLKAPLRISLGTDISPLIDTVNFRSDIQELIRLIKFVEMFILCNI